jgi:hypothetical protein
MPGFEAVSVVEFWERGRARGPLSRALMLAAAATGESEASVAEWPLGRREAALLRLRSACFGGAMPVSVVCPACGERLEFEIDASGAEIDDEGAQLTLANGARLRPLTTADLFAAAREPSFAEGARRLLARCRLDDGPPLDDEALTEADRRMEEWRRRAKIGLRLACTECGHAWSDEIDAAAYLWIEIEARARDLLDEVHWLASRYGWSEAQIQALSPARRAAYLERCLT